MSQVDRAQIEALLNVQELDNTIDQLRYKNENLPERAKLEEIRSELATLDRACSATETAREDLRKQQRSLEADAGDLEAKAKSLDAKLYDGSVTSPKEATALGEEIASLRERQSSIEDSAIELLMEIEPLDEQLVQAQAARGELEAREAEQQANLDSASSALDDETAAAESQRSDVAAAVDSVTLETYRKMRITYGPDAVARFDAPNCVGCPMTMSAVELDRWKHLPAGSLEACVDCGRLVGKLD